MNGDRTVQAIMCLCIVFTMAFSCSLIVKAETIEETVEHQAGFYYTIQRGDTLWDLSDEFFDSPWLWPELWKENEQIPNPHWIYPGERIRLFQKKGQDTFTFQIPEQESMVQESAASMEVDQEESTEVETPPPPQKEPVYYLYPPIDSVGFIRKEPVLPFGFIFKIKNDKVLVSEGDTVYISYSDKEGRPIMQGGRYTVYRKLNPTKDRKRNRALGGQYYVLGIVEVTQLEDDFVIAKVVKSFRTIAVDDFILPYDRRSPKIPIVDSVDGLVGEIIVSEEHSEIIGDLTIAFIDKGTNHNIDVGQIYNLFYQEKEELKVKGKKSVVLTPVDYGQLIVLHAERGASTVLITQTDHAVHAGALIRTPVEE